MDGLENEASGAVDQAAGDVEQAETGAQEEAKEWIEHAQDEADRAAHEPAELEQKAYSRAPDGCQGQLMRRPVATPGVAAHPTPCSASRVLQRQAAASMFALMFARRRDRRMVR